MTKTVLTYCSECDGDKNHRKLFSKTSKSSFTKTTDEFCVVECLGCDTVSFLQILRLSKKGKPIHFNYPHDEHFVYYAFLPDQYIKKLPKSIRKLYEEVMVAFNADSAILCGVGLRGLVEAICIDQSVKGSNLQEKIKRLHNEGWISRSELPILDKLRLIGNDSAHKIKIWPMRKLELALGIINHVLTSIYILPRMDSLLKIK